MRYIHEDLAGLFDGTDERIDGSPSDSEVYLLWKMHSFAEHNLNWLRRHPESPLLYDTDVRYELPEQLGKPISGRAKSQIASILRREGVSDGKIEATLEFLDGVETFLDTPRLYAERKGDCNILVTTRLAELWRQEIPAKAAMIKKHMEGVDYYHAQIQLPPIPGIADGLPSIEDPSVILGMDGEGGPTMREEMRRNIERVQTLCARAAVAVRQGADGPALGQWIQTCGFVPILENRLRRWIELSGADAAAAAGMHV